MKPSNPLTEAPEPIRETEWDFSKVPSDQLGFCAFYEYAREHPGLIQALATWRDRTELCKSRKGLVWDGPDVALPALRLHLGILTEFPEFPAKPWLEIQAGLRRDRIAHHSAAFTALANYFREKRGETAFKVLNPADFPVRLKAMLIRARTAKHSPYASGDRLRGEVEDLFCSIKWAEPLEWIVEDFRRWATQNRPKHITLVRDRSARTSRELLNALGALRLLRHFRKSKKTTEAAIGKALESTQAQKTKRPLYATRESWLRAVKRAEEHLAELA